jgi:Fe-S-cluster-containing hydrogenase component 2
MEKVLMVDMERCNGCKICELVCSSVHFEEYNPVLSHIKVLMQPQVGVHYPTIKTGCDLCGGAYKCMEWCPRDALEFVEPAEAAATMKGRVIGTVPAPLTT